MQYSRSRPAARVLVTPKAPRGLMGKWETICDAMMYIYSRVDELRAASLHEAHLMIGMKDSWRKDWLLLQQMLHNGRIWFDFFFNLRLA